jgi:triacylglycerol esterase/lipase EstA (alpha/beta hydrolase family)
MLARFQQLIVFGLLAAIACWSAYALYLGHPGWVLAGIVAMVAAYVATLGLEFCLLGASYAGEDEHRPTTAQLVSSWCQEVLIAPRVFLWQQPFRSNAVPDLLSVACRHRRGVVFVHGFVCNRGLWNPWLRRFRARGIPFAAVTLEPVFGSIDRYLETVDAAVRSVEAATGLAPILVAHSMGGLAVRAWLLRRGSAERFHRIVTIASPHHGTWMARHGRTANGLEMRIGSPWLQALAGAESAALRSRFTCFWGHCDNIVFPTAGATLAGADNRHLPTTPHVAMAFHPAVFDEVLRLVEAR